MVMTKRRDRRVTATRFKAECLGLLDDVAASRRAIVVTKRGRPVARVVPLDGPVEDLRGSVLAQGDLVAPVDDEWEAET